MRKQSSEVPKTENTITALTSRSGTACHLKLLTQGWWEISDLGAQVSQRPSANGTCGLLHLQRSLISKLRYRFAEKRSHLETPKHTLILLNSMDGDHTIRISVIKTDRCQMVPDQVCKVHGSTVQSQVCHLYPPVLSGTLSWSNGMPAPRIPLL